MIESAKHDEEFTKMAHSLMPFTRELGFEVVEAKAEKVSARAQWAADRCTSGGMLHGGYLMAVADAAGAGCAGLNLPQGSWMTTMESKTNFFRGVSEGVIEIVAVPVNIGRTTITVQTDIFNDKGKLVSRTTQTQYIIPPR
ncbi:PaaI family thioesterase [Desulfatitalea tepidiphila]|uniref:PaaI family thioesterase n=1 Tax=Desulfatitalea tepidiphila TaxID=1185843 RepID=UPI0006B48F4B|nr:PaaI family thioesterase [Desulfatitalea tepidiphila]